MCSLLVLKANRQPSGAGQPLTSRKWSICSSVRCEDMAASAPRQNLPPPESTTCSHKRPPSARRPPASSPVHPSPRLLVLHQKARGLKIRLQNQRRRGYQHATLPRNTHRTPPLTTKQLGNHLRPRPPPKYRVLQSSFKIPKVNSPGHRQLCLSQPPSRFCNSRGGAPLLSDPSRRSPRLL